MRLFYLLVFVFLFGLSNAQVCTFDNSEVDSLGIIFPSPYDPDLNPDGGIQKAACINEPYEFKFVIYVPPSVPISGFIVPIDSIKLTGEGIKGLPSGLDEETNTASDVFFPNQADCISITGIPDASNAPGEYELEIEVVIYIPGLGAQAYTFPDPAVTGEGTYILTLKSEGECSSTSSQESNRVVKTKVELLKNPVTSRLKLAFETNQPQDGKIQIVSMFGQELKRKDWRLAQGESNMEMDLIDLPQGIYFMKYKDSTNEVTKRFHIVKP